MSLSFRIDNATDAEKNLVRDSWRWSQQDTPAFSAMPSRAYAGWINAVMAGFIGADDKRIDMRPGDFLLVARDVNRPRFVYGWGLFRALNPGLALIYAATKQQWQRQGVAWGLVEAAIERVGADVATDELWYCSRTRHDDIWERWGFSHVPLQKLEAA